MLFSENKDKCLYFQRITYLVYNIIMSSSILIEFFSSWVLQNFTIKVSTVGIFFFPKLFSLFSHYIV